MDYTYGMDAMAAQNTQQDNFFNQSGNEQGSEIETQGTNFDREVVHDDAEMDDVVQGLGPLDDEWDEEEGDDPVYDHGGINPYYDFWEADPEGYQDE